MHSSRKMFYYMILLITCQMVSEAMSFVFYRCKYLYLLFNDSFFVDRNYIFTTEGHPLPVVSAWHDRLPEAYIPSNWTSVKVFFLPSLLCDDSLLLECHEYLTSFLFILGSLSLLPLSFSFSLTWYLLAFGSCLNYFQMAAIIRILKSQLLSSFANSSYCWGNYGFRCLLL